MTKLYNASDLTILITVTIESIERLENIVATSQYLINHLNTNIWVKEFAPYCNNILKKLLDKRIKYTFQKNNDPIFHRTKFLNEMSKMVETDYLSVWDADVLFPITQIIQAITCLREGKCDFIYPYNRQFYDTSQILRKLYLMKNDISILEKNVNKMEKMYLPNPIGGAFLAKHESYLKVGLENENFYGWGMEDNERYFRWIDFGFKVEFISGPLFHLTHSRGMNSKYHNQDQVVIKQREFSKVLRKMKVDYRGL